MKKIALILLIASGALNALSVTAKPVPSDQQIPVDVRRTTFITNDAEKSLKLYRDALGMKVIYDQMIESPMDNGETRKRRLVLMRANDDFIGAVGLLEYIHPKKPQRQERFNQPVPGDPIMVINAKDLETRWKHVEQAPGITVIDKPELIVYPRANGGKIKVMQSMIRDADGYWLEINKIMDAPASDND